MQLQNYMLIGLQLIIEKPIIFLHVMEFYLIMKVLVRGETFVTRKIIKGLCNIYKGKSNTLYSGKFICQKRLGAC